MLPGVFFTKTAVCDLLPNPLAVRTPMPAAKKDLADIGLIGLAVMGENLALNIESRGYTIAVFNRTTSVVDELVNGRPRARTLSAATRSKNWSRRLLVRAKS